MEALLDLTLPEQQGWEDFSSGLASLNRFALESCCPGITPSAEEAYDTVRIFLEARRTIRSSLGSPT